MIGYVMTVGGLFALMFTTALGALADRTHRKRTWLIISIILIVLGCGWLFVDSSVVSATTTMMIQSIAGAAIAPLLTNITLGLVPEEKLAMRLGLNEAFNHAGNMVTALLGGLIGYFYGIIGVFFVMSVMGVLSVVATLGINPNDVDYDWIGTREAGQPL